MSAADKFTMEALCPKCFWALVDAVVNVLRQVSLGRRQGGNCPKFFWALVHAVVNVYCWDEGNYDIMFKACIARTNFHVRTLSLRSPDGDNYRNYLKRLHVIGNDALAKRHLVQKRYREKCKLRLRRLLTVNVERAGGTTQSDSSSDEGSEGFLRRHSEAFFKTRRDRY
ncbi:hypothetical protein PHMEG_0007714 [Phytophthora megakarya]|uniref:Uncharacterized protein n=1 Tax=Phytophthora megakarya TaxID=4795 RepID=A0A225WKK3_9STRA|nr:hypothetical protein PHMEG_0007714 [Phytophthora megakarya]